MPVPGVGICLSSNGKLVLRRLSVSMRSPTFDDAGVGSKGKVAARAGPAGCLSHQRDDIGNFFGFQVRIGRGSHVFQVRYICFKLQRLKKKPRRRREAMACSW